MKIYTNIFNRKNWQRAKPRVHILMETVTNNAKIEALCLGYDTR